MAISEIILWTTSLTLAVGGITFGIKASINATKANKQIQEIVADQMVSEEAAKYFYTIPQSINQHNKQVIKYLTKTDEPTYVEYSLVAVATRMAPLPIRIEKHLERTEYKDLALHFVDTKKRLDAQFFDSIGDWKYLADNKPIARTKLNKLIKYHEQVAIEQAALLKEYSIITKV